MKMKELLGLELKKIIRNKLTLFVCIGSLTITGILFSLAVFREIAIDENGKQYVGKEAFDLERMYDSKVAGLLTEDKVKKTIAEYQKLYSDPDNLEETAEGTTLKESVFVKYIQPYYSYFKVIDEVYIEPSTIDMTFSALEDVDTAQEGSYYKARENKISTLLNQEYLDWNYSDAEKEFWINRTDKVELPYEYGYCGGWKTFLNCSELLLVGIIAICICIAPVFAGEYQSQADSVVLTTKYGKTKLVTAKILASFIFAIILFGLHIMVALGVQLLVAGADGVALPIQLMNVICPYSLTMGSAVLMVIITALVVMLGMVSLTLFLSARLAKTFLTLIVNILVIMVPMFLSISETSGIWNRVLMILPAMAVRPVYQDDFFGYFSYPIVTTFDITTIRLGVYVIVTLIFIPLAIRAFKKHEVC